MHRWAAAAAHASFSLRKTQIETAGRGCDCTTGCSRCCVFFVVVGSYNFHMQTGGSIFPEPLI